MSSVPLGATSGESTSLDEMEFFENGCFEESRGVSLCIWHAAEKEKPVMVHNGKTVVDGAVMKQAVRSWPDRRSWPVRRSYGYY